MNFVRLVILSLFVAIIWNQAQAQDTQILLAEIDESLEQSLGMTCVHTDDNLARVRCSRRSNPKHGIYVEIDIDKFFFYVKARTFGKRVIVFGSDHCDKLCGLQLVEATLSYANRYILKEGICDFSKFVYKKGICMDVYGDKFTYRVVAKKTQIGDIFSYMRVNLPK